MNSGICWYCKGRWDWILSNGLCMVCNAYKFTKCDEKSPIVEEKGIMIEEVKDVI